MEHVRSHVLRVYACVRHDGQRLRNRHDNCLKATFALGDPTVGEFGLAEQTRSRGLLK